MLQLCEKGSVNLAAVRINFVLVLRSITLIAHFYRNGKNGICNYVKRVGRLEGRYLWTGGME